MKQHKDVRQVREERKELTLGEWVPTVVVTSLSPGPEPLSWNLSWNLLLLLVCLLASSVSQFSYLKKDHVFIYLLHRAAARINRFDTSS